jgi:hypothetical protein
MLPLTSSVEVVPATVATTAVAVAALVAKDAVVALAALVANDAVLAFNARDAVTAFIACEAVTALSAIDADTALAAQDEVAFIVPTPPLRDNEPVMETLPLNWWVLFVGSLPKRVDPVIKLTDDVIV